MDIDPAALRDGILRFVIMVLSLSFHEWGHAFVADRLGDDTPRSQGRVTLFPLAHIDWIGTILIPALGALGFFGSFAMVGWAKPVQINPANFRNRNVDQAFVTIAGPAVNFVLAVLATLGIVAASRLQIAPLVEFCGMVLVGNVALMVFNLLPIPPLDGSKFLMYWFGMGEETYYRLAAYGGIVLLILINVPAFRQLLGTLFRLGLAPFESVLRLLA